MNPADIAPFATVGLVLHPALDGTADAADLVAFVAGPAGTAHTSVHPDVSVEVDFAEPDRLCGLTADDVGSSRSLALLIGPAAYRAVRMARLERGDRSQRVTGVSQRPPLTRPTTSLQPLDDELRQFGFSLAARSVGDDSYEPSLVRAVAYVEAAALLIETRWSEAVDADGLEEQLAFAADLLLQEDITESVLSELGLKGYERLRQAVVRVASWPRWAKQPWAQELMTKFPRRLFDLEEQRRRDDGTRRIVSYSSRDIRSEPAMLRFESTIAEHFSAPPTDEDVIERLGPGRFVFRSTRRPPGEWLRVLDSRSQALVALAPITLAGRRWEAHLVLPTTLDPEFVIVEPTDTPIVGAASTVDTMFDAIDHGRAAALLSAMGDPAARGQWLVCAELWTALGDDSRANRAAAYAVGKQRVTRPAFVHDAVRVGLE